MAARASHPEAGYVACLVADAALVAWTIALWWRPSHAETSSLHRGFPWAVDVCGSVLFPAVAAQLVIAGAVLLVAFTLPSREPRSGLRAASVAIAGLTVLAVVAPVVVGAFSSCVF